MTRIMIGTLAFRPGTFFRTVGTAGCKRRRISPRQFRSGLPDHDAVPHCASRRRNSHVA